MIALNPKVLYPLTSKTVNKNIEQGHAIEVVLKLTVISVVDIVEDIPCANAELLFLSFYIIKVKRNITFELNVVRSRLKKKINTCNI